jgi:hypothetical protein
MPTSVATPNDLSKVQAQVTALAEKHAALEAATAAAFVANAETEAAQAASLSAQSASLAALLERVAALEARPVYVPPPPPPAPPAIPLSLIGDRVMGMNIGGKNYDDPLYQERLARARLVVIAPYPGWRGDVNGSRVRPVVQALKQRNPALRVFLYTNVVECQPLIAGVANSYEATAKKLDAEDWWLRTAAGATLESRIQPKKLDINLTDYAKPDAAGLRFPQWYARQQHAMWFANIPEADWYHDNSNWRSRQYTGANWRLDGVDVNAQADTTMHQPWRKGMRSLWDECRSLTPGVLHMGNPDNDLSHPEFAGCLDAGFMENAQRKTWEQAWAWYSGLQKNLLDPSMACLHVTATDADAVFWLCTALLGDGMFGLTTPGDSYSTLPWLSEYDIRLGAPVAPAEKNANVMTRRYQGGVVALNAGTSETTITLSDFGAVNLPSKTGRILTAQGGA